MRISLYRAFLNLRLQRMIFILGAGPVNPTVMNSQGLKQMVHDVQLKRQKEIRDMMKKKREKAVLVDRISRWLFPTSFILLNIVYWALFGDHDLW